MSSAPPFIEKNLRILIVDDNEAIHSDFKKILCPLPGDRDFKELEAVIFGNAPQRMFLPDFRLQCVNQGEEALSLVQASCMADRRYAVAFVDVRMPPGMDGLETVTKMWDIDPDIQIVICTAYSDRSWQEMMENIKFPERLLILKKPFDGIEVLQMSLALTEKWRLLQVARSSTEKLERLLGLRTLELQASDAARRESEREFAKFLWSDKAPR